MCVKRRKNSGQAVLEYLFLIFFTIVLVSGFVYQFNGAIKTMFDSYFSADGYLACLIEKGLLPGETNDEGTCTLPAFDINSGKERKVASITFPKGRDYNYQAEGGNSVGSGADSSRINEKGTNNILPGDGGGATSKGGPSKGQTTKKGANTGSDEVSTASNAGGSSSDVVDTSSGSKYVPYYGGSSSTTANAKKTSAIPTTPRDLKSQREIAAEKKARREGRNLESTNFDLSFGNILKWVFIILLLFGLFFFVGSQMVAISRGNKKSR